MIATCLCNYLWDIIFVRIQGNKSGLNRSSPNRGPPGYIIPVVATFVYYVYTVIWTASSFFFLRVAREPAHSNSSNFVIRS
jgi:hypothetical protein